MTIVGSELNFDISTSNAMTINSSGNVTVGTQDDAVWNDTTGDGGINLRSDGILAAARNGGEPLLLNRIGTDGELIKFKKNGADIGEIGNTGTRLYLGSGDVGAAFQSDVDKRFYPIDPSNGGNGKDAYIDIGRNNVRWKDGYFAGSLNLDPSTNGNAQINLGDPNQTQGGPHGIKFYTQNGASGDHAALQFRTGDNTINFENTAAQQSIKLYPFTGQAVFNNTNNNTGDFQVKSANQNHMLFVDAQENHISINHDNPNAELDVKGEQVLRGKTNGGGITQMADSGVYTASTSATNIFQIYGLSNQSAEITIIYTDGSYRNGSFLQKIYISCHGSGTAPAGPNVIVENKSRAHNGTFPGHFTWTTSTSGSYVIFAATANTTIAGGGTIHVHVNSISSTGGKSLEMLI
jgi:hypothetical protein